MRPASKGEYSSVCLGACARPGTFVCLFCRLLVGGYYASYCLSITCFPSLCIVGFTTFGVQRRKHLEKGDESTGIPSIQVIKVTIFTLRICVQFIDLRINIGTFFRSSLHFVLELILVVP
jgi:hypothetical protein